MSDRIAQITDDVLMEVVLPASTEEWADELLFAGQLDVSRDTDDRLIVRSRVGGNTNAITCARIFLDVIEDCLREGDVDPMEFTMTVTSVERRPPAASPDSETNG